MTPLVLSEQDPASAPWWLLGVALVLLLAFVAWERRARRTHGHPLVNFGLLRTRSYALGTSLGLLYFAGFTAIFFVVTLFLQNGRGYTPLEAGLALTPFALGSAVTSAIGGRLVSRLGKSLVVLGLLAVAVGLVAVDVVLRLDPAAGRLGDRRAAPARRHRQRLRHRAEPDPRARGGAPAGGRHGGRRPADRAAHRLGGRHLRGRRGVLRPAHRDGRRLVAGHQPGPDRRRRVRRPRAAARARRPRPRPPSPARRRRHRGADGGRGRPPTPPSRTTPSRSTGRPCGAG